MALNVKSGKVEKCNTYMCHPTDGDVTFSAPSDIQALMKVREYAAERDEDFELLIDSAVVRVSRHGSIEVVGKQ
jgi:hypothetical protein